MPSTQKFSLTSHRKPYLNLLSIYDLFKAMPSDSKNYLWVWVVIFSDMENTLIEFWTICCVSTMLNKHLVAKFKGIWYSPTFNWIFPDKTKFPLANCIKTFKTNPDNGRHPPLTASLSTRLLPFQHLSWFWNVT